MKTTEPPDDLVRRLRAGGDEAAARLLVEEYGPRLIAAATMLCGNHADAEDLAIMTLQKAVSDIARFRGTSSLFSWMYGILFNLNRMMWRKRAGSRLVYTDELPETAADMPHPGGGLDAADGAEGLAAAVARLPELMREVVLLRYYGEMSIAEAAGTLGVPTGTVKSRLFNALARLREILPEDFRP